ncbi:hypothetical protein ARMGADRAFT_170303 [Armillaria gallica]|uniref:Uncharacterized protein n=1 Tax=Armillaria gallica TaxID=47427 RepID=A0A2H3DMJ4_ARMGA|nr:hypothetical protein ARMGADRAFT_170303 [Armillaria gallica]
MLCPVQPSSASRRDFHENARLYKEWPFTATRRPSNPHNRKTTVLPSSTATTPSLPSTARPASILIIAYVHRQPSLHTILPGHASLRMHTQVLRTVHSPRTSPLLCADRKRTSCLLWSSP